MNEFFVYHIARRVEIELVVGTAGGVLIAADVVAQGETMFAVAVLEVIRDAVFFAQAAHKGKIGFIELTAVIAFGVVVDQVFFCGEIVFG